MAPIRVYRMKQDVFDCKARAKQHTGAQTPFKPTWACLRPLQYISAALVRDAHMREGSIKRFISQLTVLMLKPLSALEQTSQGGAERRE